MLTRERVTTISKLAIPITIALSSSLIMTLVDLAMVRPLGHHVTAAVGLAVFSQVLILSVVVGLGPAVQGIVARRRGQGSTEPQCLPLNGGLLIALILGVPLTVFAYWFSPIYFAWISADPDVTRVGVPFLRTLFLAVVANGLNSAFKGHWTGMERQNVFMGVIVFMNVLNFCGNYVLITGRWGFPALGATGAALSTTMSVYVGVILNFALCWYNYRREGFLAAKPKKKLLVRILQLSVPGTMQDFFYAAGYVALFILVGRIGTADLAALNVVVRITFVLGIVAIALGSASATLVSRTIGEGDVAGAAAWGWDSGKLAVIVVTLMALPLVVFPKFFLSLFLVNPKTIALAVLPWQLQIGSMGVAALIYVFAYTLVSVGDGGRVALISFGTQWLFFLPAVWLVGPFLGYGLLEITYVDVAYGALSAALITAVWAQGRWKTIKI
jgi:multidrug resistance protein, MATE family